MTSLEKLAKETRRSGAAELELPKGGITIEMLLVSVSEMFPTSTNEQVRVMPTKKGWLAIVSEVGGVAEN